MKERNMNDVLKKFIEVFVENGIESTNIRALCKGANISSETVYEIYRNKEEIVVACGMYVTKHLECELRSGVKDYAHDNYAMGEFFFETFKKYKDEIRFCIQLMTSPNPAYKGIGESCPDMRVWSDEVADVLCVDKDMFEINFRLFISMMYYYCMTGDEEGAKKQRYALYEIVKREINKG